MYRLRIDEQCGLLRVTLLSGLKVHNAERAIAEVAKYCAIARGRFGELRMLLDARKGAKLPGEIAQRYDNYERTLRMVPGDRLAVIVTSSLHKQQTRAVMGGQYTSFFISESSALTWLTGEVQSSPAPVGRVANGRFY